MDKKSMGKTPITPSRKASVTVIQKVTPSKVNKPRQDAPLYGVAGAGDVTPPPGLTTPFSAGGSVRGAGCAKRGVKKCKMY